MLRTLYLITRALCRTLVILAIGAIAAAALWASVWLFWAAFV